MWGKAQKKEIHRLIERKKPIVVASHPRSGTHLTIDFLRLNFPRCNGWKLPLEPNNLLYLSLDRLESFSGAGFEYAKKVLSRATVPIIKTHSPNPRFEDLWFFGHGNSKMLDRELADCLSEHGRNIYVLRDFKKVMPSFHLWMSGFSGHAKNSGLAEFVKQENREGRNRIQQWGSHFESWSAGNAIHLLKFSDLIASPEDVANEISTRLGLACQTDCRLPKKISRLKGRLNRVFGVRPESTAILGRKRRQVGIWNDLVLPGDTREFFASVAEMDNTLKTFIQ